MDRMSSRMAIGPDIDNRTAVFRFKYADGCIQLSYENHSIDAKSKRVDEWKLCLSRYEVLELVKTFRLIGAEMTDTGLVNGCDLTTGEFFRLIVKRVSLQDMRVGLNLIRSGNHSRFIMLEVDEMITFVRELEKTLVSAHLLAELQLA